MTQNPMVKGAIAGLLSAALVDFAAFRAWQSYDDVRRFDWRMAAFRWAQGVVVGAVTAAGIGGME